MPEPSPSRPPCDRSHLEVRCPTTRHPPRNRPPRNGPGGATGRWSSGRSLLRRPHGPRGTGPDGLRPQSRGRDPGGDRAQPAPPRRAGRGGRAVPRPLPVDAARRARAGTGGRHLLPVRAHRGRPPAPGRGRPAPGGRRPAGHLPGLARLPGPSADRQLLRHRQGGRGQALLRRQRPRHHLGGPGLRHRRPAPPLPPLRHPQGRGRQPAPRLHQAGRGGARRRPGRPVRPRHPRRRDHRRRPARPDAPGQQPAGGRTGLRPGPSRHPTGLQVRQVSRPALLAGIAPGTKLVSLKVLGAAARPVQTGAPGARVRPKDINGESGKLLRVHGVNLSLGYEFDPQVVRLRPEPHLRRGRPPGPLGGGGGRRGRQHRLRQRSPPGPPDRRSGWP